ncbi:HlyD family efflux transporter periplasmic adaptor subunit [Pusillimonas noertemannii]|uniref:HlyD family secretion protein n=1 Tax=Pusillimonas noertemannii TaxID=305977 RepID=A0A2U1CT41_9BURK|nr:HlyD family efflux transporter periplasmic adaptor subunit [Pusillimonas noertemannii]NYT70495.1 HlyD family efflux transporter periplasmic adaptor subunit [Pusillimonas noertemannii]PVY68994.1 HlyD family secretion protein [Pusillimonas noertemannii]TFL11567.1 HlyD family efflux transporter periplasmic adaptor subunit [Pusillimonas noertemannii]
MKKPLVLVVVALAVMLAAWAWWHSNQHEDEGALVLYGNVDIRQISLAFDGNGRVTEVRAEEGDAVRAGSVLAVLDTRTLALQAEQAQAQLEATEQALLSLRNGARPQELAQARSRLAATQAEALQAEQDLKRLQGISAQTQGRGVSAQDLDRARSALRVAQARVAEQGEALHLMELGPRAEEVAGAQAQAEAARAQLALLRHQIAQGELKAPADAVVRSRLLEPGDMATPQRPVFALALIQPKWIRVYVAEPDLGRIRPGMEARVFTDGRPSEAIAGRVGYISSVAEFTPKTVQTEQQRTSLVYEARVVVEDADNVLRLGQPATVHLIAGEAQ